MCRVPRSDGQGTCGQKQAQEARTYEVASHGCSLGQEKLQIGGAECWSYDNKAAAASVLEGLSWCDGCGVRALQALSDVSDQECVTWTDEHANDYLKAVKGAVGGLQKAPKNTRMGLPIGRKRTGTLRITTVRKMMMCRMIF